MHGDICRQHFSSVVSAGICAIDVANATLVDDREGRYGELLHAFW